MERSASERFVPVRSNPERSLPDRSALGPIRYPPMSCQSGGRTGVPVMSPDRTPVRFTVVRSTLFRSALVRSAFVRSASGPIRQPLMSCQSVGKEDGVPVIPPDRTPVRVALPRLVFVRSVFVKSAFVRFAAFGK